MQFDMIRVREKGWVIPRHNHGLYKPVRGSFTVRDVNHEKLRRTSRTASFITVEGHALHLYDAALVYATTSMIVLTGFECDDNGATQRDYAQSWVLTECEGDAPVAHMGPAFVT